jgi:hypothetical protein
MSGHKYFKKLFKQHALATAPEIIKYLLANNRRFEGSPLLALLKDSGNPVVKQPNEKGWLMLSGYFPEGSQISPRVASNIRHI